jgi:hypothetical protein
MNSQYLIPLSIGLFDVIYIEKDIVRGMSAGTTTYLLWR